MNDKQLKETMRREVRLHIPYAPPSAEQKPYDTTPAAYASLLPAPSNTRKYAAGAAACVAVLAGTAVAVHFLTLSGPGEESSAPNLTTGTTAAVSTAAPVPTESSEWTMPDTTVPLESTTHPSNVIASDQLPTTTRLFPLETENTTFSGSGLTQPTADLPATDVPILPEGALGNTITNLCRGAPLVQAGEWTYYGAYQSIFKISDSGTTSQKVVSIDRALRYYGLQIADNWLYFMVKFEYSANRLPALYRCTTDGKHLQLIMEMNDHSLDHRELNRIDGMSNFFICGNWIYYISDPTDVALYKMRLNGTEKQLVSEIGNCLWTMTVDGDYAFMVVGTGTTESPLGSLTYQLLRVSLKTGQTKILADDFNPNHTYYIFTGVCNGWLYYMEPVSVDQYSGYVNIKRMRTDGTDDMIIFTTESSLNGTAAKTGFDIVGDMLYFHDKWRSYCIDLKGSPCLAGIIDRYDNSIDDFEYFVLGNFIYFKDRYDYVYFRQSLTGDASTAQQLLL